MSTAGGRVVLLIGLPCATCLLSSETGREPVEPTGLSHQEEEVPSPAFVGRWAASRAAELSPSLSGPTVVTIRERPVERLPALNQPLMPRGRDAIGRQLQKELKRVGCYGGALNGVWTTSTRQAMKAFTDRVNAVLPIDEPDSILLTLVQGHPDKVCGIPCPVGQGLSDTGQCLPKGILARTGGTKVAATTSKKSTPATSAWTVKTTLASTPNTDTDRPDSAAIPAPTPPMAAPPEPAQVPRRTTERRQHFPVNRQGSWADNLFKQRDRSSIN
jgi:hypothetical protein